MEQYILQCLDDINLYDNYNFNGSEFACQENFPKLNPCCKCLSCKLKLLQNFSLSLLNHMNDKDIIYFIKTCMKFSSDTQFINILESIFCPLISKDRVYSLSRTVPSLNTDLVDYSIRNFTVDKTQLSHLTNKIGTWISKQPDTFRFQFIFTLLSHLKMSILMEIFRSISDEKEKLSECNVDILSKGQETSYLEGGEQLKSTPIYTIRNGRKTQIQIDLISSLPIHISKKIINMLDEKSLKMCSNICENWKNIVTQVRREFVVNEKIREQAMLLKSPNDGNKSFSTKPVDSTFARDTDVKVPQLLPGSLEIISLDSTKSTDRKIFVDNISDAKYEKTEDMMGSRKVFSMDKAFRNIVTKTVIMEERNVFCGSYSVMLIKERQKGEMRTISYNGGDLVAVGGSSKAIQFLNKNGNQTNLANCRIHGHAGSIKVLRIISEPGKLISNQRSLDNNPKDTQILSGSYDTTIRRWDCHTRKCLKIYIGHSSTITDLDFGEAYFISGSLDGTCKLWQYDEKQCLLTMRHKYPVTSVTMSEKICISGDLKGIIKVWNIQNGKHIKSLIGHQKEISSLKSDKFHIVSASHDCFVMVWSSVGKFDLCIGNFRHPKPVICMEYCYLRAITGCEDGKIRIWDILAGQCIRIIRGNSKYDPILNMIARDDTMVINTVSNILVFNFEPIAWVYESDKINGKNTPIANSTQSQVVENKATICRHLDQRSERSRFAGNIDPRIFLIPTNETSETKSHKPNAGSLLNNLRLFDNGMPLTRSTAWLVSPTLNKSKDFSKEKLQISDERNDEVKNEENKLATTETTNVKRCRTTSSSGRRISYGFEGQNHLSGPVGLDDIKHTLRKHIRSPPQVSAEAMPEFIKSMVSQLKEATATGRAISATDNGHLTRPSSGPSKMDSKSKISVDIIKNFIRPKSEEISVSPEVNEKTGSLSENQVKKHSSNQKPPKSPVSANIKTYSSQPSNQLLFTSFFVPPDFRQKLHQRKLEFDQRHSNQPVDSNPSLATENFRFSKSKISNLNLQTFEGSQLQFQEIERINQEHEKKQRMIVERERYSKWLKNVEVPVSKYEKDAIMKRPRSAKI